MYPCIHRFDRRGPALVESLFDRPRWGPPLRTAVGMLNARVAVSPRLVLARTDLDAINLEELCSRRSISKLCRVATEES